jgi:hypothetical protein
MLLAALLAAGHVVSAQNPPQQAAGPRTGLILGRVVDAVSGTPVPGAVVQLLRNERDEQLKIGAVSGADGQFVFAALPSGGFMLMARKPGYAPASTGQTRPSQHVEPAWIELKPAERRGDVTLRMWKHTAITGRVVNEAGEPLTGVQVSAYRRIFKAGRPGLDAHDARGVTDDRGIYRISRLVPGDYVVGVIRNQRAVPASVIDEIKRVEQTGDKAEAERMNGELRRFATWIDPAGSADSMRIGTSYVDIDVPAPSIRADGVYIYSSLYYPGTPALSAARVLSLGSDELPGIDLTLRATRSVPVSGVLMEGDKPAANFPVRLVPEGTQALSGDWAGPQITTMTDARGRYTFPLVPAGAYRVSAFRAQPAWFEATAIMFGEEGGGAVLSTFEAPPAAEAPVLPTRFASVDITVGDRPVDAPMLSLAAGVKVTGRVTFAGATKPPPPDRLKSLVVVFESADGRTSGMDFETTGKVDERGNFESVELPPGRYLLRTHPLPGWTIASAMVNGRDASVTPFELGSTALGGVDIRFTDQPSVVGGSVMNDAGADDRGLRVVVLFPADRAGWVDYGDTPRRLAEQTPDGSGAFEIRGIPPGDYFIAAIFSDGLRDWRDPATLERLSRQANRIRVAAGDRQSVSLKVIR